MRRNDRLGQLGGLPRRGTDRIEDLAAWLLAVACVVGLIIIWTYAGQVRTGQLERARQELTSRSPQAAVLMRDVRSSALTGRSGDRAVGATPVRWTGTDGVERFGMASVAEPMTAGQTVTVWVDRNQRLVRAPVNEHDATVVAVQVAGLLLSGLAMGVGIGWTGVRRWALARNCLGWEREWSRVEPVWTGRAHGEQLS